MINTRDILCTGLPIIQLRTLLIDLRIRKVRPAFGAYVEEDHAGFGPFGLVLVEYGAVFAIS